MESNSYCDTFNEEKLVFKEEDKDLKFEIYNLSSLSVNYDESQIYLDKDQEEFELVKVSESFLEYLKSNSKYESFTNILKSFLDHYYINNDYKPKDCTITMFEFPNEDYREPMVKILYYDDEKFDNLRIKDDIEEKFKVFLAKNSKDLEEFKSLRKIQQKFRFIIRRE